MKQTILKKIFPGKQLSRELVDEESAALVAALPAFKKALMVEGIKRSNLINVSFENEDPHMAAAVVNRLADIYLEHHLSVHKKAKSYKFFQEQSQLLKNRLNLAEVELKALKKQYNVTSLEEERSLLLKEEAALRSALNHTISLEVETEKRIHQIRNQLAVTPKSIPQKETINQNERLISTLEARLVELELQEKKLLTKYSDQNRLVANIKDEIRMVRGKLTEHENKHYGSKDSGVNPTYQRLQEELYRYEADIDALKAKKKTQRAQLQDYQITLEKLNEVEIELNHLVQVIDVYRQNYRLYLTKFEESRISDAMDSEKIAGVSLIEPAHPPLKPDKPKVKLILLLGVLLGGLGGLGLAFFMDRLSDGLETVEDVEKCLQLPVLASIPESKKLKI